MDIRIQHTKTIKESGIYHFYQKCPLIFREGLFRKFDQSIVKVYSLEWKYQRHG